VVKVKLSAAEKASMSAAAEREGLALAAYLGQAGMDRAEHRAVPVPALQQEMLTVLLRAESLVSRAGTNVNQAVARFHATGRPALDLESSAAYCARVARHLDEAAELVRRRLR
jgi:hypothetical protein